MVDIVTFDGINKIITEISIGADNELDWVEIYSEWKDWVRGRQPFNTETGVAADQVTSLTHGQQTGDPAVYSNAGGTETIGLTDGVTYYLNVIDPNTFEVYDTEANAITGGATGRQALTASGAGNGEVHEFVCNHAKFELAITYVGGDPISPSQNLGSTFFLENGWRLRPAELNHKLTIVGNIFTREPGQSIFVNTLGAFTVNTETRVSNLVDSSVARLDLNQLLQAVYIDSVKGVAGTGDDVGTPTNPVDNIADARTIADNRNLFGYKIRGSYTLLENHEEWIFEGQAATFADIVNIGGFSIDKSRFDRVTLTGSMSGGVECDRCNIEILTGLSGTLRRSGINQSVTLAAGTETTMESCFSTVPDSGTPTITFSANSQLNMRNYSGGVQVNGMTAGCVASIDCDPGHVIIDSSCTGGTLLIRGMGRITNNGAGVTVIDTGFMSAVELDMIYHAVAGNANVNISDTQVEILDESLNVIRTLSVSVDGRTRRIV